ncbi:juvenile hormone esterase-like [Homalodisca vitripennis]|uniref:juvenile hormone esterase-like n=1 Tax=Homalodisca vitripennis TaxID=197043 RepID=UPI001EEB44C2|nr:juvenile hormone esterase-like [Homalodisca vitripennis]
MKNINLQFILLSVLNAYIAADAHSSLVVDSSYGSLRGKWMTSRGGRQFATFLGIPYALPPTGHLRFLPPSPPLKWNGTRDATVEGKACVQREVRGDEDCLYLNVFTHSTNNSGQTSPVMVYIHGGGFYGGSSSLGMYGPEYLLDRNIVLVTLQYRLGVFGFLSTEDSIIPGNMGLKDQTIALQWVQENIKVFGGDASKVTIFGNSAGSASVHLHMLSPGSRRLFSKAISQSGTALSAFAMIGRGTSRNITFQLARSLNCSTDSSYQILNCLQNKTSTDVQKKYSSLQDTKYEIKKVLFRPIVEEESENAFLTSNPLHIHTDKPWLVGINQNEGLFKISLKHLNETIHLIKTEFDQFGPAVLFFEDTCSKPVEMAGLIYNFYFKNDSTKNDMIVSIERVISDSWFLWPTMQSIGNHNGTLYCYLFNHTGEHSVTQFNGGPQHFGVSHMDELHYLFSRKRIIPNGLNKVDENVSKMLIDLWVNFAEETNPTPDSISSNPQQRGTNNSITWESSNSADPKFLLIETNMLSMVENVFKTRMEFWKKLSVRDKIV